jgi:hypothetical protein
MILSDEPGYYEDGKFGIRIENIVKIVPADTKHNFQGTVINYKIFPDFPLDPVVVTGIQHLIFSFIAFGILQDAHAYIHLLAVLRVWIWIHIDLIGWIRTRICI